MFSENEMIERIQAITKEMEQCKANHAKLEGHMQETMHWLTKIRESQSIEQGGGDNGEVNPEGAE